MAAPPDIGVSTRVAGVWENVHSPQTRLAGVWTPIVKIHTMVASVWEVVFASAAEETNITSRSITDFDFSGPYNTATTYRLYDTGIAETESTDGGGPNEITGQWIRYNSGRTYEYKWDLVSSNSKGSLTSPNAEATWADITGTIEWELAYGSGFQVDTATRVITVTIREKTTLAGEVSANITFSNENG